MRVTRPSLAQAFDDRGTSAVEFAIIGPIFIALVVATFHLCIGLYAVASLNFAVEEGARCASVNTTVCSNAGKIITYTQGRYSGPAISPSFTYAAASCGNSVSASATYVANIGVTVTVPLSASSCFP
jgi:Flp pilus assembly protein TadG